MGEAGANAAHLTTGQTVHRKENMRMITKGFVAGLGLFLWSGTSVLAQELTIFWAEWDPANFCKSERV